MTRSCPSPHVPLQPPAHAGNLWAARGSCGVLDTSSPGSVTMMELWSPAHPTQTQTTKQLAQLMGSLLQEERAGVALLLGHAIKQGPLAADTWPQGGTSHPLFPKEAGWSQGCFHQNPAALKGTKQEVSTQLHALLLQHPSPATAAMQAAPYCTPAQSYPWPAVFCHPAPAPAAAESHPPPTSGTAAMQKAASKTPLGIGSAASQGWQRRRPLATATHTRKRDLFCPGTVPSSPRLWLHWPRGTPCPHPRQDGVGSTALLLPQPGAGASWHNHGPEQGFHLWGHPAQAAGKQSPWHRPPSGHEGMGDLTASSRLLPSLILTEGDKQGCTEEAALYPHLSSLTRESISIRPGQQHLPTHLQQRGRSLAQVQGRCGTAQGGCGARQLAQLSPPRAATCLLPGRKGLSSSSWGSRHRPISQHIRHGPGALTSLTVVSAQLRARAPTSLLPLHSLSLPSCYGLHYRTVYLPLDEDQVQLFRKSLRASPYPTEMGQKEDWSRKATRGTAGQTVHKQIAEEEPKTEERCW